MQLLTPSAGLILWQLIIFVMLFLLLAKLAWKPIINSLKERENSIHEALSTAEKARLEMSQLKSDNEKLLREAREERERILREARDASNRLKDEAVTEAKKAADKIIEEARAAINVEKAAALRDVKTQVAMFSLQVAEKLMKKSLSDEKAQKELVQSYLEDVKVN